MNMSHRFYMYLWKTQNTSTYSYLRIHLNMLLYVDYVFIRKYTHIWFWTLTFLKVLFSRSNLVYFFSRHLATVSAVCQFFADLRTSFWTVKTSFNPKLSSEVIWPTFEWEEIASSVQGPSSGLHSRNLAKGNNKSHQFLSISYWSK